MHLAKMKLRKCDAFGCGHFGASRGKRVHNGVDLEALPGTLVTIRHAGTVTKLGYCYGDDLSYRYVQVETPHGYRFRYFYVDPRVSVGDTVQAGDVIGAAQAIADRYPEITPHIHFEIIDPAGQHVDPMPALIAWGGPAG